jgi:(S)-2-hydroxyglutarate dehydrogenase
MKRIVIVGSGIIGLSLAYWIKRKRPEYHIQIIEKESGLGAHASGRNSGVLHAGFYYTPDSLKARFCKEGQSFLISYIKENRLAINQCGKLVVTKNEDELNSLKDLRSRAKENGVDLEWCSQSRVSQIDPMVKTYKNALFSPTTATIDPHEVLITLKSELETMGVTFHFDESYVSFNGKRVLTNNNGYDADFLLNCAGTYAVDIAKQFNLGENYQMLPFKGLYLMAEGDNPLKTNVYPVPPKNAPFLGVHFTITVDNKLKIGPTATPVFSYEQYSGFDDIKLKELIPILGYDAVMFMLNRSHFRSLAIEETRKFSKNYLAKQACKLTKGLDPAMFTTWSTPGIRAQLLDKKRFQLVDDFIIAQNKNSLHVLNAVSPAFTASFSFSCHIVEEYIV